MGIIIFTIFLAIAMSLIVRWNRVNISAEAVDGQIPQPQVVNELPQYEDYVIRVQGRDIAIHALLNERAMIVRSNAEPEPDAKPIAAITGTPVPAPQEEEPVQAPDEQTMGDQQIENATATLVLPTPVPVQNPTATPAIIRDATAGKVGFISHVVQPGQTRFRLTQIYDNTSLDMLARHGITEADMVVGNTIQVPFANGAACASGRACPINEGDTLYSLARLHGTTVQRLQELNGLANFDITAGEAICVP